MQTAMPMPSSKVRLKLYIQKSSNRVLFAEAGEEFVDFFDNILHLPVGTLIKLIKPEIMFCSLGNINDSISRLKSNVHVSGNIVGTRRFLNNLSSIDRKFGSTKCPSCGSRMLSERKYAPYLVMNDLEGVKDALYLVMNDLEVKPLSIVSVFTLFNKFHLKNDGDIEEKVVDLGMDEQNVDAGKAFLSNPEVTESYCQLCMERVEKYEMMDILEGLFYVTNELNKKYQPKLTVYDVIDKYMELRSSWKIWIKLIKDEEKLVALDWVNGKITTEDNSWWERKLKEFPEAAFIREVGLPDVSILDIVFDSVTMVVPKGVGIDEARVSLEDSDSKASTAGSDKVKLMKKVKRRLAKIPELKSDEALAMFCKELFVDLSKRAWFCAIQPNQRLLWLQSEFKEFNKRQQESEANESHSTIARDSHSDAESFSESLKKSTNHSDGSKMY